jgi:TonB family protein
MLASDCVGSIIDGRFPLLRWIGGTERSSVFRTELEGDPPRRAAIKLIPVSAVDAGACLDQWAAASSLSHPHLVRLFDFGHCAIDGDEYLYVVTEYADEILSDILAARPLSPPETREMLGPVLDALSWLHARDLVHAHLKPSNIMVVDDRLKLSVDRLRSDGEFGRPSLSSGKGDAPEIATGILSPAADAWSLGVLVVEALTLRPPVWNASSDAEPILPAPMPRPFSSIARGCLQVDPAIRWTLSDIRASLEPARPAEPAHAAKASGRSMATPPFRLRTTITAGAAVFLVGTITALVISSHHGKPSPPALTQTSAPPAATTLAAKPPQSSAPESPGPATAPSQSPVVKGEVASRATPDVPQPILDTIQGHVRVRIRVQVDSQGKVADAAIDDPGTSRYFAAKALASARNWKFTPAQVGGHSAASAWILHFQFGQTGTTITPIETAP